MKMYISLEAAKALKEIAFNEGCDYSYVNSYGVNEWAQKEFPGLSDDGYLDLLKDYGGAYEEEEIYGSKIEVKNHYSRNIGWGEDEYVICSCPTVEQVMQWLFEKYNILLSVCHDTSQALENGEFVEGQHYCYYYKMSVMYNDRAGVLRMVRKNHTYGSYKEYMDAWSAGIIRCVSYIKHYAKREESEKWV